jgi:phosphoglycerate dehydrogenase-like enzyme
MNILITQPKGKTKDIYFPEDILNRLRSIGTVIENPGDTKPDPEEFAEMIRGVDVCITHWNHPKFDTAVLDNADKLKLITHAAGSVASFITDAVYQRGITVCSANKVMARYVAESVAAFILSGLKKIPAYDGAMKKGEQWPDLGGVGSFFEAKLGLVGLGMVGRFLLDLIKPFSPEVRIYDPYVNPEEAGIGYDNVRFTGLDEVLSWADIVSLHAAKTPETYHMINQEKFSLMKDGALFINTARGAVIDQEALENELAGGRISAVLDVYEQEPLPLDSRLRKLGNVILLPHKGAAASRSQMTRAMADEIERFSKGLPLEYVIPFETYRRMTR